VEAVSKCLAFSCYKAREDERAQGARRKRRTGEKEKTGAEPRIGRRKQRKKKLKKKKREKPEGAHVQPAERHAFITISFVLSGGKNRGD
jgi:hypothetical protein